MSVSLSAIMLFSALAVAPLTATAAETQVVSKADISGAYEYEMNGDGTVKISRYYGNETEVTIPDKIEGKSVSNTPDCFTICLLCSFFYHYKMTSCKPCKSIQHLLRQTLFFSYLFYRFPNSISDKIHTASPQG